MSDRDALIAGICAQPDEDTPRLALADYLEEFGEPEYAAFVRAQVELARTPAWEPLAVKARWQAPTLATGKPFLKHLAPVPGGMLLSWDSPPFRRGLGWSLLVRSVPLWGELVEPVLAREPIGKFAFWHGTLDDWYRVAASPQVARFRDLTFHSNPIEPLRALRDVPETAGVTDLRFQKSSGAGMPEVLEDLFRAPLGRTVSGLHFHVGYESLTELIDALALRPPLARLSFSTMGITHEHLRRLLVSGAGAELTALSFRNEPLGAHALHELSAGAPPALRDLELQSVAAGADGLEALSRCDRLTALRRLSLSRNPLTPRAARVLSLSRALAGLRSLDLSDCRVGDKGVRHVTQAKFWPNLVEIDLRKNPISGAGVKYLLDAALPPDLTALVLTGDGLGSEARAGLVRKYGAAAVLVPGEVPTW
jgi:uncharacterized protein (TIGR02996 family)